MRGEFANDRLIDNCWFKCKIVNLVSIARQPDCVGLRLVPMSRKVLLLTIVKNSQDFPTKQNTFISLYAHRVVACAVHQKCNRPLH